MTVPRICQIRRTMGCLLKMRLISTLKLHSLSKIDEEIMVRFGIVPWV